MSRKGGGTIYKQPGCSTWSIQYFRNGKRIRESTGETDYAAASQTLNLRVGAIAKGEYVERDRKPALVSELFEEIERDYKIQKHRTLKKLQGAWKNHLKAVFADMQAQNVTSQCLKAYVDIRLREGASNAIINRELAALKRMFRLGYKDRRLMRLPIFPHLKEPAARKGFVEDAKFARLTANANELWLRLWLELAFTYGWRKGELLDLRVGQVNLVNRTIRLDPGTTKNGEGREVAMSAKVTELLRLAVTGKHDDDYVLKRVVRGKPAEPIKDMRDAWQKLCVKAGLGKLVCRECEQAVNAEKHCAACKQDRTMDELKYVGLIPHDLRRSAAKALRAAGVAESVIMDTGGWKTNSMFRRYAIVSGKDQRAAVDMLEQKRLENSKLDSHDFSHDSASLTPVEAEGVKARLN